MTEIFSGLSVKMEVDMKKYTAKIDRPIGYIHHGTAYPIMVP